MSVKKKGLPQRTRMRHDRHYVDDLMGRDESRFQVKDIAISRIHPNPDQPRKDLGDLENLAASIKEQGILEPILVKKNGMDYTIISGERRYQAGKLAGLDKIHCIIRDFSEERTLEVALVENLQRKDLHPFEEADGLRSLMQDFKYTHEMIAQKIGKSRSSVTETITLAGLDPVVRQAAADAGINAKTMLLGIARLETQEEQLEMIEQIQQGADREAVRKKGKKQERSQPYVFKYRSPNKAFSFNLRFKKSEVEQAELIDALEAVLIDLKNNQS